MISGCLQGGKFLTFPLMFHTIMIVLDYRHFSESKEKQKQERTPCRDLLIGGC